MDIMRPKLTRIGNMYFRRLDIPNDGIIDDFSDKDFNPKTQIKDIDNVPQIKGNNTQNKDNGAQNKDNGAQNKNNSALNKNNGAQNKDNGAQNKDNSALNKNNCAQNKDNEAQNKENTENTLFKLKSVNALEESESSEDIEDISGGKGNRFRAQIEIGKYFHRFIVGHKGQQKEDIEFQSRCRIVVPYQTDLTSAIVITGNTESDVKCAIDKLRVIVKKARNRSDFTHFVSIPFNGESICERFVTFKTQILKDNQINKGIDESLFQIKNKLHLTVVPLLLTDENERKIATEILDNCHNNYIKPLISGQPIKVKLEGIEYMNDDPTQVNVIYAKVHDMSDKPRLQPIVDYLFDQFKESGLTWNRSQQSVNADSKVKMHVTLINTTFKQNTERPDRQRGNDRRDNRNKTFFDGSGILNKFKDYYFGELNIDSIEVSIRHGRDLGTNGYYSHSSRIEL